MIGQIVSHYRILHQLGEGGMGVVYVAEDTRLGRRVAIKFPAARGDERHFRARFLREARSVSALNHSHIAAVYDYGETPEGQPFIVMELVKGQTLAELLRAGELTLSRAVEIVIETAEALGEAHKRGVIHRDIKPSNIIINEQGEVKVLDFGLAKQLMEETPSEVDGDARTLLATNTRSDAVLGTPLYLSPEQARSAPVDARSDIFALGALLYECVAGRPAFSGANILEIAAQVLHVDPPPPSHVNPRVPLVLDQIALKALAKSPADRYQSAAEMVSDLKVARSSITAADDSRVVRLASSPAAFGASALSTLSYKLRRPRFSITAIAAAVVVAALAIWGIASLVRPRPHQPPPEALRWYEEGTNALREGAYYQASKALEQAISADENFALAHARMAEALTELDYADRAKDHMLRVTALVPNRSALPRVEALYLDAIISTVMRDFPRAVAAYSEIARLTPNQAQVYVDLGRAYENTNETGKAIENYIAAATRDQQYAPAFLRLAILYGRQQDTASANDAFRRADDIYRARGNIEGRTEVHFQRGFLYRNSGHIAEARIELQQALDMAQATDNQSQQIKTLLQLSSVAFAENNLPQAHQYANQAVTLARSGGMENLIGRGLIDLGNAFFVRGDYEQAEIYFQQALDAAQRIQARRNEARALLMLASLRIEQRNPDAATQLAQQALPFYQQGGFQQEAARAVTILARAYRLKGDYEAALTALRQQLQQAEQTGNNAQAALAHQGIGSTLLQQERHTEALRHFEEAMAISRTLGDQRGVGYALMARGQTLWQLGRYEEARAALQATQELADRPEGGYRPLLAATHESRAGMALSEQRWSVAQEQARQALTLAANQRDATALQAKLTLALALAATGGAREGRRLCEEVLTTATQLGDTWLISQAQLALALAALASGDAAGAQTAALSVAEACARTGQLESRWRALLVAARAAHRAGDAQKAREYAALASETLAQLQQRWGAEAFNLYLARPDTQTARRQLNEEFSSS